MNRRPYWREGIKLALRLFVIWPLREYLGLYPSPHGETNKKGRP